VTIRFDRRGFTRWLTFALTTAALHFVWEMAQAGRFASMASLSFWRATRLCARATVGDVVITAIAFAIAAAAARSFHWPAEKGQSLLPFAIFIVSGLAVTVAYEIHAIAVGQWSYAETMPTIASVGVLPILQWLVIPIAELAVFRILWRSRV
jgi:membrane protease YdiL (CAAX protease family)